MHVDINKNVTSDGVNLSTTEQQNNAENNKMMSGVVVGKRMLLMDSRPLPQEEDNREGHLWLRGREHCR